MLFGIGKSDIKYTGRLEIADLIRAILPQRVGVSSTSCKLLANASNDRVLSVTKR